ncbi:MAG: alkaline phosphatase family protein [Chitinophagales bacterium]|nr:alkaline phosphatase family protein [Chitinophagales bacterium]
MKKLLLYICVFLHVTGVAAQKTDALSRPKLVVGIVVDQMRWDYLYKYCERYGDDGFKRMINEGYNCQNTMINYLPSFTGPGHACVYTGSVPAIHGIASNDWLDLQNGNEVYCVEDNSVRSVGGSMRAGMMSPRNMYTTTVTDELRIASKQHSKVFGIGLKDRGSILPAGHSANGAFWFDDSTGNFITSSYYMNELPAWLVRFNGRRWADSFVDLAWKTLYPLGTYTHSTRDNMVTEGKLQGEDAPVFPHYTPREKKKPYYGLRIMPWGNTLTLKAARACIKGEQLGQREETDFLCITLSTTDYAGHNYGPDAIEMEDMYLRLDLELAQMLRYLDNKVGKGKYTVFLTADHGAAHNAAYMNQLRIPAGSETQAEATGKVNEYLVEQTGVDSVVRALYNYQVYLDEQLIAGKGLDRDEIKKLVIRWLYQQDGVAMVADMETADMVMIPEPIRTMIVNGYNRERSGCLQIILKPGWYSGHSNTGTTHGTWSPYDTHIPLLWYGWGIPEGETYRTVYMTDIAATLAAMLHVQMPNGCTGSVITELFED